MKTLLIVRHGKSSWDDPALSDGERPLKERGITDAGKMADKLLKQQFIPEKVFSSPAKRARQTAEIFCQTFGIPAGEITIEEKLYFHGAGIIVGVVKKTDDSINKIMIAGHNPDFTDVANQFISQNLYNLPTAGVVVLQFDCASWNDISRNNLVNDIILIPKKL